MNNETTTCSSCSSSYSVTTWGDTCPECGYGDHVGCSAADPCSRCVDATEKEEQFG